MSFSKYVWSVFAHPSEAATFTCVNGCECQGLQSECKIEGLLCHVILFLMAGALQGTSPMADLEIGDQRSRPVPSEIATLTSVETWELSGVAR